MKIWYTIFIENKILLEEIIKDFLLKGGKVNKHYLNSAYKGPSLVFYKRWYRGRNIRDAIKRALAE